VQHDERLALGRIDGTSGDVGLTAGRGEVVAPQGLRCALSEEVDLEGGVDCHEAVLGGHLVGVVGVVDGPELDAGVPVDEVVAPLATATMTSLPSVM
jgi:hypothetical protein